MRIYVNYCLGDAAELEVADGTDLTEPFTGYCRDTDETLRVLRPWDADIEIIPETEEPVSAADECDPYAEFRMDAADHGF